MIGLLKGKVFKKGIDFIILDVNGVGYKVFCPLSTICNINSENILLLIETIVKEDSITLYGFLSEKEKELFNRLISVSKVGPKLALAILSGLPCDKVIIAIKSNNIKLLSSIPGVGKKTAERICFDLKEKIKDSIELDSSSDIVQIDKEKDLTEALVSLGYKANEIKDSIKKVLKENKDESIENLIRMVLNELYNG